MILNISFNYPAVLNDQLSGNFRQIFACVHKQIGLLDNDLELLQVFCLNQVSVCPLLVFLGHLTCCRSQVSATVYDQCCNIVIPGLTRNPAQPFIVSLFFWMPDQVRHDEFGIFLNIKTVSTKRHLNEIRCSDLY